MNARFALTAISSQRIAGSSMGSPGLLPLPILRAALIAASPPRLNTLDTAFLSTDWIITSSQPVLGICFIRYPRAGVRHGEAGDSKTPGAFMTIHQLCCLSNGFQMSYPYHALGRSLLADSSPKWGMGDGKWREVLSLLVKA